jgi:hypothetical protein
LPTKPQSLVNVEEVADSKGTSQMLDTVAETMQRLQQAMSKSDFYLPSVDVRKAVCWIADGRARRLVRAADANDANRSQDQAMEPARLSVIVRVTHKDFWMMSDCQWRPNTVVQFSNIKLTSTGQAPEWPLLMQDFKQAVSNVRYFMQLVQTPGATRAGVISEDAGVTKLRFRHVPFRVSWYVCLLEVMTDHATL